MRKGDLVRVRMDPASHHRGHMALRPTTPDERAQWYNGFYKQVAKGLTSLHGFDCLPTLPPEHTWLELDRNGVYEVLRGRAKPPFRWFHVHGKWSLLLDFRSGRSIYVRREFIEELP